jgi:hypothetical protein
MKNAVKSIFMKYYCLFLLSFIWVFTGCEVPQTNSNLSSRGAPEDLKINQLGGESTPINVDFLMKFKVLTYTIDPASINDLKRVVESLSREEVRIVNKSAFSDNGFAVGTGSFKEGNRTVQKFFQIGAASTGQISIMFPPDSTEHFTGISLRGGEVIHYTKSADGLGVLSPGRSFLGWALAAKQDTRFREMAQIKLFPATWKPGGESIRLAMGEEPVDYKPIKEGQVFARIEEGGFILLCPSRSVTEETTLDKVLFFLPGSKPKVRFYLIICESVGT